MRSRQYLYLALIALTLAGLVVAGGLLDLPGGEGALRPVSAEDHDHAYLIHDDWGLQTVRGKHRADDEHVLDDAQPVWCPLGTTGPFDARTLVGKPAREAKKAAKRQGCTIMVIRRDGVPTVTVQDAMLRPGRITATVADGVIIAVRMGLPCSLAKQALPGCAGAQGAVRLPSPPRTIPDPL